MTFRRRDGDRNARTQGRFQGGGSARQVNLPLCSVFIQAASVSGKMEGNMRTLFSFLVIVFFNDQRRVRPDFPAAEEA